MSTAKSEVQPFLEKLPDDCTLEDIQYHLYVVEKIHRGIEWAAKEGEYLNRMSRNDLANGMPNNL